MCKLLYVQFTFAKILFKNDLYCYYLETKYPSLCANCKNPLACNSNDQFWGRQGALTCLSEGYGDVAWARLSDVKLQFKV